ncbi:hypothetical protein AQUCO_03600093v1 [Aquilegia coerulea]|uniref:Auxin-repressed protein n=1 Tax=Aquilegia coerulea TaxID=218851 RepID=A0A2G5CVB4_AQUCA|nr:hypothetical protein AQUCO_03600093v1 [Aquilegia coerulea]
MVLLDKLWDDVSGGPSPEQGLGRLRKLATSKPLIIKGVEVDATTSRYQRSMSMPVSPNTPVTPVTPSTPKENVWRSVFHPGSNIATKNIGSAVFDKPQPNSPSVYDWYALQW